MLTAGAALAVAALGWVGRELPRIDGAQPPFVERPPFEPSLSAAAQRIDRLVDAGKYEAAATLLESELGRHPDDGGLYYVEARCRVAREPVLVLFEDSGAYEHVVRSCRRAVEFDEHLRPRVARMLVRDLARILLLESVVGDGLCAPDLSAYVQMKRANFGGPADMWPDDVTVAAESGPFGGLAAAGLEFQLNLQFGHTFVGGPWVLLLRAAREFDAAAAQSAASELDAPANAFAERGMYAAGALVASLRAELRGSRGADNLLECCKFLTKHLDGLAARGCERGRALVACDVLLGAFQQDATALRGSRELRELFAALRRELPVDTISCLEHRHSL